MKRYSPRPDTSYVISASLSPKCYRHIQIGGDQTLSDLSEAILSSFDFDDDHLSSFYMNNKLYSNFQEYELRPDGKSKAAKTTLNKLKLRKGKRFKYLYDFGDEWVFQCSVLSLLNEITPEWKIIKEVGKSPEQY